MSQLEGKTADDERGKTDGKRLPARFRPQRFPDEKQDSDDRVDEGDANPYHSQ